MLKYPIDIRVIRLWGLVCFLDLKDRKLLLQGFVIFHVNLAFDGQPGVVGIAFLITSGQKPIHTRISDTMDNPKSKEELIAVMSWLIVDKASVLNRTINEFVWVKVD